MLVKFVFFYYFISHGDSKWLHGVAIGIVEGSDHIIVIIDYVFFELHFLIINIRLSNFHIKINWQNEYKVKFFTLTKFLLTCVLMLFSSLHSLWTDPLFQLHDLYICLVVDIFFGYLGRLHFLYIHSLLFYLPKVLSKCTVLNWKIEVFIQLCCNPAIKASFGTFIGSLFSPPSSIICPVLQVTLSLLAFWAI